MRNSLIVFVCLTLISCMSIPLKSLYRLSRTDLMDINPEEIQAAAQFPDNIQVGEKGVNLTLRSLKGDKKDKLLFKEDIFILEKVTPSLEAGFMKKRHKEHYTLSIYRLKVEDIPRFISFRDNHKAMRQKFGKQAKGQIALAVDLCHLGNTPPKNLLLSTWLALDLNVGFIPITNKIDLIKKMKKSGMEQLPLCS